MKRLFLAFILITAVSLSLSEAAFGFALNISPPSLHAEVKAGGSTSGSIIVENRGEEPIGILSYTQDWAYKEDGSKTFLAAGTQPLSCAKWIRLFPKKFQLGGGERMTVQYTINLPQNAVGGYYAVIFFESVPVGERQGEDGMLIKFSGRLGTIVYIDTKGKTERAAVIDSLDVTPPSSNSPLVMDLSYRNEGNTHISADGTLNVIDEEGNVYAKEKFGPVNTLPAETRKTNVEWYGELDPGSYIAVATFDIETDAPLVEEKEFSITSGASIESFSVDPSDASPSFSVTVSNKGDLNVDISGRIEIYDAAGASVKDLELKKTLIAPGKERQLSVSSDQELEPGSYKAKAVILMDGKELTKEETFSVSF